MSDAVEAALAGVSDAQSSTIERISRDGRLPLSYAQERLWSLDQAYPCNPIYNTSAAYLFKGSLKIEALEKSFGEVIKRHEALRTTFDFVDGRPAQIIYPPEPMKLGVIDLSE